MHVIQLHHISVNYAGRDVFSDFTWAVDNQAKVGLVGPNGAGKSSLLKVLAGEVTPTRGTITSLRGISVGYLPQEVRLPEGTLYEAACAPSPDLGEIVRALEGIEAKLSQPSVYNDADALAEALEKQAALLERYERIDPGRQASRVRELLAKLGIGQDEFDLPTHALSGGQTKLAALARLAAWSPDVLLLDEPDNHLDLSAKAALEGFLRDYRGGVLLVSHDRYLLDAVVTQIAELESGALTLYVGDYSNYTVEREVKRIRQQQAYTAQQKVIQRIEAAIKEWEEKAKADLSERHARQAASRRKMLARMEERGEMIDAVRERQLMALQLAGGRGSTKALEVVDLAMAFDENLLFVGLNLLVKHGERVGLIGRNGAGKSVLFKLILGEMQPVSGVIKVGSSTRIGYYAQQHETLTEYGDRTPVELVRSLQPIGEGAAVNRLLKFAFTYEQTSQPIGAFSGGERSRLQLLMLVLQQPNLLLLDEPTNNLDIASSEVLETALEDFEGAILAISHDRYFLDRIVDRIVELDDGALVEYVGGYSDYVGQKAARIEARLQAERLEAERRARAKPKKRG
ncbi:MAG: ABC-F family ATP-binding cassette domain-containing protein [Anaerolineae bacterium]|nr:ABC-F family ATP-binding cassette domain-containing protein [Anaerolineae bacterium]